MIKGVVSVYVFWNDLFLVDLVQLGRFRRWTMNHNLFFILSCIAHLKLTEVNNLAYPTKRCRIIDIFTTKSRNGKQRIGSTVPFILAGSSQRIHRLKLYCLFNTPGIQKHVTVLNTRNGTKIYIGMIKGELYLFSSNKQCGHLPTANVYIHIEYYF